MVSLEFFKTVTLDHYLLLSTFLFTIGMVGVLLRKNLIVILMCIELMLNAVNLSLIAFGHYSQNIDGQILVFFVMVIAAAEAGVGLAIAVAVYKRFKKVNIDNFETLKG
jgi:NADH-quinone oxidoreductase subunit K